MANRQQNGAVALQEAPGVSGGISYFQTPEKERPSPRALESLEFSVQGPTQGPLATSEFSLRSRHIFLGSGGKGVMGKQTQKGNTVLWGAVCYERPNGGCEGGA